MRRLLHFAEDGDTSGYFPQLARWHDRSRYQMSFGTLLPMAPWLRAFMEARGVQCFSCECRGRAGYPLGLARLVRFLRRERIEVLHAHLFDPAVVGLAAGVLAGTPARVLTRHHSDYHTRINKTWHVRLDQLCTRMAHRVIAVSQHTADHLIARERAPAGKVRTILNGIDHDRVRPSAPDAPARLRREFAPGETALLLAVGRLHPEKGYEHLFKAIARLRGLTTRPFTLLVAGRGPFESAYRARVEALGCAGVVRFLGFRRDAADLMAAADLVVLPSLAEAFGLALAEALALGTPVVASRVGGVPEVVSDGVDGVLVPPADAEALARALADLLNHPEKRARLAGAGRSKMVENFQFENMMKNYESIYDQLGPRACEAAHV